MHTSVARPHSGTEGGKEEVERSCPSNGATWVIQFLEPFFIGDGLAPGSFDVFLETLGRLSVVCGMLMGLWAMESDGPMDFATTSPLEVGSSSLFPGFSPITARTVFGFCVMSSIRRSQPSVSFSIGGEIWSRGVDVKVFLPICLLALFKILT